MRKLLEKLEFVSAMPLVVEWKQAPVNVARVLDPFRGEWEKWRMRLQRPAYHEVINSMYSACIECGYDDDEIISDPKGVFDAVFMRRCKQNAYTRDRDARMQKKWDEDEAKRIKMSAERAAALKIRRAERASGAKKGMV